MSDISPVGQLVCDEVARFVDKGGLVVGEAAGRLRPDMTATVPKVFAVMPASAGADAIDSRLSAVNFGPTSAAVASPPPVTRAATVPVVAIVVVL